MTTILPTCHMVILEEPAKIAAVESIACTIVMSGPIVAASSGPTLVKVFEAMDSIGGNNGVEISGSTAMRVYSFSHIGKEYWAALSNANPELQRHSV